MFLSWLKPTRCHACESTIEQGLWFCKTCGRSRGINGVLQFKKWELIVASGGLTLSVFVLFSVLSTIVLVIRASTSATAEGPAVDNPSPPLASDTDHVVQATATPRPVRTITPQATVTQLSGFASYSCPDKSLVKLRVGDRAIVAYYDVNLRTSAKVPDVWDANIVVTLHEGNQMRVTGGPECAYDGTWWEVETDTGYTGWVREQQPNKILIKPVK